MKTFVGAKQVHASTHCASWGCRSSIFITCVKAMERSTHLCYQQYQEVQGLRGALCFCVLWKGLQEQNVDMGKKKNNHKFNCLNPVPLKDNSEERSTSEPPKLCIVGCIS